MRVGGFITPAVLVFGPVVDQQQDAGGGQVVNETVEQGLRLGIDPVQILKDQQQRLHLALAQQYAPEGVEQTLTPLRWIEGAKRAVVRQGIQQPEEGRDGLLQGLVQRQHLPGDPGPDGTRLIGVLDMDIALQQVDDQ